MVFRSPSIWRAHDRVPRRFQCRLGGKALGLYRLAGLKLPVPPFLVIPTVVFEEAIKLQRGTIDTLLAGIDWDRRESVESVSTRIQESILDAQIPHSVVRQLAGALVTEFEAGTSFAVRSSAVGEDSREHSFAGQMESFLHVDRDGVLDAVRKVWASAFSIRALLYRTERGLPLCGITTAVIVQQMVASESSGVAFSRDPQTREATCVITAGYGLGEGIVQDLVETDTYRVDAGSVVIARSIGTNKRRAVHDHSGGVRVESVAASLRARSVLTEGQILQVAALVRELETAQGSPQDVEWAYELGQLFVLQMRPIVFQSSPGQAEGRLWDNSNIVESYPGLTLPLTFSFVQECYATSFRRAVEGFLLFRREVQDDLHIFREMIGLLDGRVYYNLFNWYKMLSYLPDYQRYRKSWDSMIGITQAVPFPESRLSLPNRMFVWGAVLYRLLSVRRTARKFFRHFQPTYRRYQSLEWARFQADELLSTYRAMQRDFSQRWHLTLYNDFCAIKYYDWLRTLCGRWGLERFGNLHNDLLCGEDGVESVQPLRSLLSLCMMVRRERGFQELFTEASDRQIWSRIQSCPEFALLKAALDHHLMAFGDRGLEELKLEQPTFRDRPEAVIGLLKSYLDRGTSCEQLAHMEHRLRAQAESHVKSRLRNPFKRALFAWVLRQARCAVANRENMRFARSRLFGITRRLFRRLADLFAEQGILDCREDFYYLTLPEVFGYVQGTSVTQNLRRLVDLRREEYARFETRSLPDRLHTTGTPYPVPIVSEASREPGEGSLWGTGCSSGKVRGAAWVVSDPRATDRTGDYVLVAESTDPGWAFLMIRARGIVVERGSVLSHTAIIGRELGIPTVVGVRSATARIQDGSPISINGSTGEVRCE